MVTFRPIVAIILGVIGANLNPDQVSSLCKNLTEANTIFRVLPVQRSGLMRLLVASVEGVLIG